MTHYVILSVNQVLSIILNMSCLQNEAILENIFDEILEKCYQRNLHLLFGEQELEELAARRYARVPLGRLATVEEISSVCLFLASEGAGYMTGQTMHVNGAADCR